MTSGIDKILETHAMVLEEGYVRDKPIALDKDTQGKTPTRKCYVVSNLRGGVGKSSITFNLAFEISRKHTLLVGDVCPQCNTTEILLGDFKPKTNIYSALQPSILGPAFGEVPEDLSYRIPQYCEPFRGGRGAHIIPGNPELFAFPSTLYQQLNIAHSQSNKPAVKKLLHTMRNIMKSEAEHVSASRILIDTSPFYAGGTHLAWCAADALIVPVRVDEHSIESLELMFQQLSDPKKDFRTWNERGGGLPAPKVAAIVMTMVGSKSKVRSMPDEASRMYIERAFKLAMQHQKLFACEDPTDAFVLTDDFHSAGRVSGAKRLPISELNIKSFHSVEGRRLQVNQSVTRYQRELRYLASLV